MPFREEDYIIKDFIGEGGFAIVLKIRHKKWGYVRALRILNNVITNGEADPVYKKFQEECKLLFRLGNGSHPNIVQIHQALLSHNNNAVVVMDYVNGETLTDVIKANSGFVNCEEVLRLLSDIGSALAYCHEDIYKYCLDKEDDDLKDDPNDGRKALLDDATRQQLIEKYRVIHNDIHSGNIMRRDDGRYVLLDFGLAIENGDVVRSSRRKNGVAEFMAPEKWDGESELTTQTDIYSFGIVLYEYLAGRVPFPRDEKIKNILEADLLVMNAHKQQTPQPIYELRKASFEKRYPGQQYEKDYPDWLEELIMKCLEKSKDSRFKNGKELFEFVMNHASSMKIDDAVLDALRADVNDANARKEELEQSNQSLQEQIAQLRKQLSERSKAHKPGVNVIDYANGDHYEGDLQNGVIHGVGTYTWANGESYKGKFLNGKWNDNKATFYWPQGLQYKKYVGGYKDNVLDGPGIVYDQEDVPIEKREYKNGTLVNRSIIK